MGFYWNIAALTEVVQTKHGGGGGGYADTG